MLQWRPHHSFVWALGARSITDIDKSAGAHGAWGQLRVSDLAIDGVAVVGQPSPRPLLRAAAVAGGVSDRGIVKIAAAARRQIRRRPAGSGRQIRQRR